MDTELWELSERRSKRPVAGTVAPIPGGSGALLAPGEKTLNSDS
jgi:hypothetical protein